MSRKNALWLANALVFMLMAHNGFAAKYELSVASDDLTVYSSSDTTFGNYYTLQFQIPEIVKEHKFYGAILEFYVDVASLEGDSVAMQMPLLEVYALRGSFSGVVDSLHFVLPSATVRRVELGENRRVAFDISEIVERYLGNPNDNHGLIIGSLKNERNGIFAIKQDAMGRDVVAKIEFHYDSRARM